MKNSRGKFYINRIKNVIVFGVLEMDERFRNLDTGCGSISFQSKTGVTICSQGMISFSERYIYLRGVIKESDNKFVSYVFLNIKEAKKYEELLKESLIDWSRNCKRFENTNCNEDKEEHIFEV